MFKSLNKKEINNWFAKYSKNRQLCIQNKDNEPTEIKKRIVFGSIITLFR